ncbi:hypothetical protein CHUAL_009813 [Chamberlinius hualienensis]
MPCNCGKSHKLVRPSELPIYDQHIVSHQIDRQQLDNEANFLQDHVKTARLLTFKTLGTLSESTSKIAHVISTGKAHTISAIYYLREEENLLPRIGAVAFGALFGSLLGIRGKFFKRFAYGTVGAGAVASLCYPNEAQQFFKSSYTIAKYYAIIGYNRAQDELSSHKPAAKVEEKKKTEEKPKESIEKIGEQPIDKSSTPAPAKQSAPVLKKVGAIEKDYGQSNPEDKDMYTTRGS